MPDNEIIKALECLIGREVRCDSCLYYARSLPKCREYAAMDALNLINRQKAEIERLQKAYEVEATDNMLVNSENDELKAKLAMAEDYLNPLPFKNAYDEAIDKAKSEALKAFANRKCENCCFSKPATFGKSKKIHSMNIISLQKRKQRKFR